MCSGTCCSWAWEKSLTLPQLLVSEGNRTDLFHLCLCPLWLGEPCVLGVPLSGAWGEHECIPLCGAALGVVYSFRDAESGLEDVWVGPGWEGSCEDSAGAAELLPLIDLIGAALQGWRNTRWPGFSRRGEARGRRPGTGQIINVN